MWTAVPAAVFVTALMLTFATLIASVCLTRRVKGKIFIEVRLFGLGFTISRDSNQDSEIEETSKEAVKANQSKAKNVRHSQRSRSQ